MNKIIYVMHRREDITHNEFLREWSSERHVSLVQAVPGLTRYVQNLVVPQIRSRVSPSVTGSQSCGSRAPKRCPRLSSRRRSLRRWSTHKAS